MGGAKETNIPDKDGALAALAALGAHAETLKTKTSAITKDITSLEAGAPWGTWEGGKTFHKEYTAGSDGKGNGGGADFVKNNVNILADEVTNGAQAGYTAVMNNVTGDEDMQSWFKTSKSDSVGTGLQNTSTAYNNAVNAANKDS